LSRRSAFSLLSVEEDLSELGASVLWVVAVESHLRGRDLWNDELNLMPALVLQRWEIYLDRVVYYPLIRLRIGWDRDDDSLRVTAWAVVCRFDADPNKSCISPLEVKFNPAVATTL